MLPDSHTILFIIRWLYSDKDAPHLAQQLAKDYETSKIHVLINDFYPDTLYNPVTSTSTYHSEHQYKYDYQDNEYFQTTKKGTLAKVKKALGLPR
jgi:hypothetical protein